MLPLQQAYEVRTSILEYIHATYRFKDKDVGDAFYKFIEDSRHGMIKGPYVSLKTPFISAQKDTPIPLDIKPSFPPYQHTNSVRYAVSDSGDMRSLVFQVFLRLQS